MRKEKWWSLLILVPMLAFVGDHYVGFLKDTVSFFPNHLLSAVFCAATVVIYPLFIFKEKKLRTAGAAISVVILLAATVFSLSTGRSVYRTTVMVSGGNLNVEFDDSYSANPEDEAYGKVFIVYEENSESYMINAEFTKTGKTKMVLEAPDGTKRTFDLVVSRDSYHVEEETGGTGQ